MIGKEKLTESVTALSRWAAWVKSLTIVRIFLHFSQRDGVLLSAGMSFQSLFAVFAAVWVGFSIAGIWLTSNDLLFSALVQIISQAVPGLIGPNGAISEDALLQTTGVFGWTGLIAAVGLIWTMISWLFYTRRAVRSIFDLSRDTTNFVIQRLRDFGLALGFGIVLIVAATLSVASTQLLRTIFDWIGISHDSSWVVIAVRISGLLLVVAMNTFALGSLFRVLSRVHIPWRNLFVGSLLGSIALAVLSLLSGVLIGGAGNNPLLASFTVILGLLIWFNLVGRVILLSASWIAVRMSDKGIPARWISPDQLKEEQEQREHHARLLVAQADLEEAVDSHAAAHGIRRLSTKRRVKAAQSRVDALVTDDAEAAARP